MKNRITKTKNLILLFGALLLINIGCVELDETPKDFTGPSNFYTSTSQVEAAFTSAMNRIYNEWGGYGYAYWQFSDDDQILGGELVLSDGQGSSLWGDHYRAIADINPAIKALNEDKLGTSASQTTKDELMAQAKFIRAFNYFSLVRLFGPVPLIKEDTDPVNDEIVRSPIVDVYKFIEDDLLFAVQHLPNQWPSENRGRPANGAAKTVLAKVYITMATAPLNEISNYQKAKAMAADVMDDGIFDLVPEVDKVFALENSYGKEVIWSFNAAEDDNATPPQIWLPGSMANGWGDIKVDKVWGESFPAQPRKDAYLLLEDWDGEPYTTFYGSTPYVKKFIYDTRENQERFRSVQNIALLRYADVLLLFAEADNMINGGPTQAAVNAVNLIINRANGDITGGGPDNPADKRVTMGMSKEAFDAAVIQQRSLELCFEYDRWYDLIRKRILCTTAIPEIKQNCDENDYLWPIPQTDLRLNPLLTQNPGYTTPE